MVLKLLHISESEINRYRSQAENRLLPKILETADLFSRLKVRGVANEWLLRQEWKRALAVIIFSDLLGGDSNYKKVLEIGGSLSYFTLALAKRYNYLLIEKATHEAVDDYHRIEQYLGKSIVFLGDWNDYAARESQDLIIANDLFPNVDQRLYEFIESFLPITNELRLSLTFYENTFFEVQRIRSNEKLIMRPWGLREIQNFVNFLVSEYPQWCQGADYQQLRYIDFKGSLFSNRRNIIYMRITKNE